jgi:hypothetical protein
LKVNEGGFASDNFMAEKPTTYLTILTKNGLFSFLGLVRAEMVDAGDRIKPIIAVVKLDPREDQPMLKQFDSGSEATRNFEEAINTSVERGWSVVYRGRPMFG